MIDFWNMKEAHSRCPPNSIQSLILFRQFVHLSGRFFKVERNLEDFSKSWVDSADRTMALPWVFERIPKGAATRQAPV